MLVGFNEICDSSRIWIFQSDLKIENNKIELIKNDLEKFLIQWSSHGKELQCSYEKCSELGLESTVLDETRWK